MFCCQFPSPLQFGARYLGFFFPGKRWRTDESGHRRPKLDARRYNSEERRPKTSDEPEVELRLPLEVDMGPDRIRKDVPINSGAVNLDAVDPDQETQRRFGLPNRAKPKWPRHGFLTLPHTPEPHIGSYRGSGYSR